MSFADSRNAIGIGVSSLVTLSGSSVSTDYNLSKLLTESGDNLVQEDGGLILLEQS